MKTKVTIAAVILLTSVHAFAEYMPSLGRFISRDPIEEKGGLNLYAFCENDPINNWDYLGFWKKGDTIDGGKRRIYIREGSESPKELATLVNLDANEINKWAKYEDNKNCKISVPNTIIAYWAGDVGMLGRWWVDWNDNVKQLKDEGFFVDEQRYNSSSALKEYDLERKMLASAQQKRLYGLYFWGHGYTDGSGLSPKLMSYDSLLQNPNFYKLARVHIFACNCDEGAKNISADGKGQGRTGTYCPWHPWRNYGF